MGFPRIVIIISTLVFAVAIRAAEPAQTDQADRSSASNVPAKVRRYVDRLLLQRDVDGDGRLAEDEWRQMSGDPAQVDINGDKVVTHDELLLHVSRYGLARMPVRLLPPGGRTATDPAVNSQSTTTDAEPRVDDASNTTDAESEPTP